MMNVKPWGLALILGGFLGGAALLPASALAQSDDSQDVTEEDTGAQEDPVVAVVEGEEIRRSDVLESARELPQQYQQQIGLIFPALVERLVDFKLLDKAAAERGLGDDEAVQEQLERVKVDIMREVLLSRVIEDAISDEQVREAYEAHLETNPAQQEVRARHILLESEEEARTVIEQLDGGADFAELAKEKSTGPTGEAGGDLGYFTQGQMVEPFAEAAFAMEPGSYSESPVETQFGWHVIKVEDKRDQTPATFEEMEQQLVDQLSRQAVEAYLAELREGSDVEILLPEPQQGGAAEVPLDDAADDMTEEDTGAQ
jgi:peptidyl-prolyl cis-trans isomerase C